MQIKAYLRCNYGEKTFCQAGCGRTWQNMWQNLDWQKGLVLPRALLHVQGGGRARAAANMPQTLA